MDPVDKLYECYEILANEKTKTEEHESEYLQILHSVKGSNSEKMLACQFIPRFIRHFPHLTDKAIDAQLDLVEDIDSSIRKQAIKHLPSICKDFPNYVIKIADILAQMLQSEDTSEISIVNTALVTILKLGTCSTLRGLFSQIRTADDNVIRKRTVNFICNKLKFLPPDMLTKEVEQCIIDECKTVFQYVNSEEFTSLMALLTNLKAAKTIIGQQALVNVILEQAELEKEFNTDTTDILYVIQCVRHAIPFFSQYVNSNTFVKYVCLNILPILPKLLAVEGVDAGLELTKLLAETAPYVNNLEGMELYIRNIYEALLQFIPLPPAEGLENESKNEPNFQFTHIESLMYSFHQMLKKEQDFWVGDKNAELLKDFKIRLHYLARSIQSCIKSIKDSLLNEKEKTQQSDDHKLKSIALRTMTNINTLIRDFFHNPPSFKTSITLSWKPLSSSLINRSAVDVARAMKRKESPVEDSFKLSKKEWKGPRQLYEPPGGKYSSNVKTFYPPNRSRFYRGRGRGGRRFY